jgi:hypothetical protein
VRAGEHPDGAHEVHDACETRATQRPEPATPKGPS